MEIAALFYHVHLSLLFFFVETCRLNHSHFYKKGARAQHFSVHISRLFIFINQIPTLRMAEALLSELLELLTSITDQEVVDQEDRLVLGNEKEVANLTGNLKAIQAVIQDAEGRQLNENAVRDWLDNLKEVLYEIEDMLNEWNDKILRQQIEKQEKEGENAVASKKKVCLSISFYFFRRGVAQKMKSLNKKLNFIANESRKLTIRHLKSFIEESEQHKTSSFVDTTEIIGRENERELLLRELLSGSSEERGGPVVVPIVGMGGIGKTTLAQLVYNSKEVAACFEKRIWVYVSDTFEVIKIAKAIIEALDKNDKPELNDLQTLLQLMHKSLQGKRFLLVLDDVWTEDYSEWEQLKLPLQNGVMSSRILVTTRNLGVAAMMGATDHMIHLNVLSQEACYSLFLRTAMSDREIDEVGAHADISKELVKRCGGLPLAVKVLGHFMRYKQTRTEWLEVLDNMTSKEVDRDQNVFKMLFLSYCNLGSTVKRCLLYCSIFPKDFKFDKDILIELWMSQHYLDTKENMEKEIIGQNYFDDLVMQSFIQVFEKDVDGNITSYIMHDLLHDFVTFLTRNECFIMEAESAINGIVLSSVKVRHLTIMSSPEGPFPYFPISSCNWKNLHTLATFDSNINVLDPNLFLELKYLRTLNLSYNRIKELPEEIGKLVHLRYIELSHNLSLKELPNSVCNLYNLQTLRLVRCTRLKKLPEAMGKLISLQHLHVKDSNELKYFPKGIGRLTSLRRLDEYTACDGDNNEAFKLGDLRNLDQLRGSLSIKKLGDIKDVSEAEKAQLWNKEYLLKLELDFENEEGEWRSSDVETLNALKPHENLEFLSIGCYDGITDSPTWMISSLHNLRTLILDEWKYCKLLPPLGKLRSLEKLEISGMHNLKKVGAEFLGMGETRIIFPKLKQLSFRIMQEWEDWEGLEGLTEEDSGIKIMPCLSSLQITSCSRLKTLPNFLWNTPLCELNVNWCPILALGFQKGKGEEWQKISHIPNIRIHGLVVP